MLSCHPSALLSMQSINWIKENITLRKKRQKSKRFYFLCFILLSISLPLFARRSDKIWLHCQNQSLKSVLSEISREAKVSFVFQDQLIKEKQVNCFFEDMLLEEALDRLLKPINIFYQWTADNVIVLFKNDMTSSALKGIIMDREEKKPLPHANIFLKNTKKGSTSDSTGFFILTDVADNSDTLLIHYIGYASKEIPTSLFHDGRLIQIKLDQNPLIADSINITGNKNLSFTISEKNAGQLQFSPIDLDYLPSTSNADFQRTLQLIPGISASYDKPAELCIFGGNRYHNNIYLDGIPVIMKPELYFGMINPFDKQTIEEAKIYKAGFPVIYGDCIGGIIELTGNTLKENRFRVGLGLDLFSINSYIQIPVSDKVKWFFTVNRSHNNINNGSLYQDFYTTAKENYTTLYYSDNSSGLIYNRDYRYSFFRTLSKLSYDASSNDLLSFTIYLGDEKKSGEYRDRLNPYTYQFETSWRWENTGLSLQWSHRWNTIFCSHFSVIHSNDFRPYDSYLKVYHPLAMNVIYHDSSGFSNQRIRCTIVKNNNQIKFKLIELNIGAEILKRDLVYNIRDVCDVPYLDSLTSQFTLYNYQGEDQSIKNVYYIQTGCYPIKRINFEMGLRAVDYGVSEKQYQDGYHFNRKQDSRFKMNWMPRATFIFSISEDIKLSSSWGRYYQYFFAMNDLGDKNRAFELWWYADKDLPPLSADHTIMQLTYHRMSYRFSIEAYYKILKKIAMHENDIPSYLEFSANKKYLNEKDSFYYGSGKAKGFSLTIQKLAGKLTGWLSYNFSKVIHQFPAINQGKPFPPQFERKHEFKVASCLSLGSWRVTSVGIYSSPIQFNRNEVIFIRDSWTTRYDFNLPSYYRFDLGISRFFHDFLFMNWEVGISLLNVFNYRTVISRVIDNNNENNYLLIAERRSLPSIPLFFLNITYP
jgi:hypothetical protein